MIGSPSHPPPGLGPRCGVWHICSIERTQMWRISKSNKHTTCRRWSSGVEAGGRTSLTSADVPARLDERNIWGIFFPQLSLCELGRAEPPLQKNPDPAGLERGSGFVNSLNNVLRSTACPEDRRSTISRHWAEDVWRQSYTLLTMFTHTCFFVCLRAGG